MPIIITHILEGRSAEVKAALIRNLSQTAAETLDVPIETVRVIVSEMKKDEYGIGGQTAKDLGR